MSSKSSRSLRSKKEELGSHSRCDKLKILMETQLYTYTDHYGVTWHEKKRDFVNTPINLYDSLGSIGHIIIGETRKVTTTSDTLESHEESVLLWLTSYESISSLALVYLTSSLATMALHL